MQAGRISLHYLQNSLVLLTILNGSTGEFARWLHVVEHDYSKAFWLSSSSPVLFLYSLPVIPHHTSTPCHKWSTLGLCSAAPTQWEPLAPAAVLLWKSHSPAHKTLGEEQGPHGAPTPGWRRKAEELVLFFLVVSYRLVSFSNSLISGEVCFHVPGADGVSICSLCYLLSCRLLNGGKKKTKQITFRKKEAGVKMLTWLSSRPKRCLK